MATTAEFLWERLESGDSGGIAVVRALLVLVRSSNPLVETFLLAACFESPSG
jgi:hypothetical protein